jgi:hypothetical protein
VCDLLVMDYDTAMSKLGQARSQLGELREAFEDFLSSLQGARRMRKRVEQEQEGLVPFSLTALTEVSAIGTLLSVWESMALVGSAGMRRQIISGHRLYYGYCGSRGMRRRRSCVVGILLRFGIPRSP